MKTSDFRYEKKLGSGAYGAAYFVRRKADNVPFVIKEQNEKGSYETVINEVRLLKKMKHPNIVAYHGSWEKDGIYYILMEYASRGTLQRLLQQRDSPLKEDDALYMFSQIVLGVHHIHKRMVLHRDLKPGNIMLTGSRGDVIKIGDFGVSKNIQRELGQTSIGTRTYMAPEVFKRSPYDFKCDIWSLGVILYEMLTKKFPFDTRDYGKMIGQICTGTIHAVPEGVSSDIARLIYKMLKKDPEDRPRAGQLVLCPVILPSISRVYANVGRSEKALILGRDTFDNYVRSTPS